MGQNVDMSGENGGGFPCMLNFGTLSMVVLRMEIGMQMDPGP